MKYRLLNPGGLVIIIAFLFISCKEQAEKDISILVSTDIHGVILPYDFIEKKDLNASLANVSEYVKKLRKEKDVVLLLDNGDNLQGQPEVYFYNFIDTVSPHLLSEAMNFIGYDAGAVGNHDIETGHSVYDRLANEYKFPLLAANAVDIVSNKSYFRPYIILEKKNIRIAVFGLVTPAIPNWLPPELYSGIEFRDMVETANLWIPEIRKQNPDLVVGLFHSGWDRDDTIYIKNDALHENGSAAVAYNVPGFDIIFTGHDHRLANEKFINREGEKVIILNGGSRSENIAQADISFSYGTVKGKKQKRITGKIIEVKEYEPDREFLEKFESQDKTVREYVNKVIGTSTATISSRDSYFGPSAFVDMIHAIQLEVTGADISFAAPLSFDVMISEGPVTVGDMFKLYRYENMLYTMTLSGGEIEKYLEFSYSEWLNTMKGPDDYLLKFRLGRDGKPVITDGKAWTRNQSYNFDSAAGIDYIVDVSKPEGERITIRSMTDGRPFEKSKTYKVAINSYRGNGGGGHLIRGVGINPEALRLRLVSSTERDLRYYILRYIEAMEIINPLPYNNWEIVPVDWVKTAAIRDYHILFGNTETMPFKNKISPEESPLLSN